MECRFTPVRSPQSNSMAESVIKTFKRDYVFNHPRDTAHTVLSQLDEWIHMTTTKLPLTRAYGCFLQESSSVPRESEIVRFCRGNSNQ